MSELPVKSEPISEVDRLRQEITDLINSGIVEVAARNPNVLEYMRHWEGRAETAEAALAASDARIAELEAEVERLRAGPKVKPLEWREVTSPREDGPPEPTGEVEADTLIGCYSISIDGAEVDEGGVGWKWSAWTPFDSLGHFGDLDEAKSAAQADYETRILSALVQP